MDEYERHKRPQLTLGVLLRKLDDFVRNGVPLNTPICNGGMEGYEALQDIILETHPAGKCLIFDSCSYWENEK